jgi:hypothetical protein
MRRLIDASSLAIDLSSGASPAWSMRTRALYAMPTSRLSRR